MAAAKVNDPRNMDLNYLGFLLLESAVLLTATKLVAW
jgi:hypothetical protein